MRKPRSILLCFGVIEEVQQWQSRPLEPPAKYVALLLLVLASL